MRVRVRARVRARGWAKPTSSAVATWWSSSKVILTPLHIEARARRRVCARRREHALRHDQREKAAPRPAGARRTPRALSLSAHTRSPARPRIWPGSPRARAGHVRHAPYRVWFLVVSGTPRRSALLFSIPPCGEQARPAGCLRLDRLDRLDSDGRVRSAHKLRARPGLKGMGPRTSPSRATGLHVAPPSATLACRANTCTSLAVDGACALARARFALCACEAAGGVRCDRCGGAECEQRRAPGGWMRGGRC